MKDLCPFRKSESAFSTSSSLLVSITLPTHVTISNIQRIMDEIKSVVVGDGTVGKTCLLISFTSDKYDDTYIPTIFDTYTVNIMVDGKPFNIGLWDTAGQEEYDRLRPLSYPSTDVFLICYSVTSRTSFNNVKHKWIPEINQYCPEGCAKILVGTKADLRPSDPDPKTNSNPVTDTPDTPDTAGHDMSSFVTFEEADELAKRSDMDGYFECSALTGEGVKAVFDDAIRSSILKRNEKLDADRRRANRRSLFNCAIM